MLQFAPDEAQGIKGGHAGPQNAFDWLAGCFGGLTPPCSAGCDAAHAKCVDNGDKGDNSDNGGGGGGTKHTAYAKCLTQTLVRSGECAAGCTPTYAMLSRSEAPLTRNLTAATAWGAPAAVHAPRPPHSVCEVPGGPPTPVPPTPPPTPAPPTPPPTPAPPTPPTPPTPPPAPGPQPPAACLAECRAVCPGEEGTGAPCRACLQKQEWNPALEKACHQGAPVPFPELLDAFCGSN